MPNDWGAASATAFVPTSHSTANATLDPTTARLPASYTVCIVGASRGIGAGVATAYAKAGASQLILAARRVSGLEETATRCRALNPQVEIEIVPCDITSAESVAGLAARARARFARLDAVVVNSGFSGPVMLRLDETDPGTFANAASVNYVGTFLCAKYLIPALLETEGGGRAFIVVNSLASLIVRGPIANAQYCVSKCAQLKLLECAHEQYHGEGLACFAVHPGAVMSEMAEESAPENFREYLTDDAELCGAFCVWLTKDGNKRHWLSGRLLSAKWDADELESRKDEIVERDLLKLRLSI